MTTQEIKNALIEYATEDTQIAMENETLAITDTKKGVITLNFLNGTFQAFNRMGEALTGKVNRAFMINWLTNTYQVG